jgi:hypothetical protein
MFNSSIAPWLIALCIARPQSDCRSNALSYFLRVTISSVNLATHDKNHVSRGLASYKSHQPPRSYSTVKRSDRINPELTETRGG